MSKIHTRAKRRKGGGTHLQKPRPETRARAKRPRTFKSESVARKWAESKGITAFVLENLKVGMKDKKIRVVIK